MKIIILEPNLKACTGHPYTTIKEMVSKKSSIFQNFPLCTEIHFVCHEKCTKELQEEIPNLENYATKTCFETKNFKDVLSYIKLIIKKYSLKSEDLIIFSTAHLNEINVAKYVSMERNTPKFLLQIHQFYTPLKDSSLIYNPEIKEHFRKLFKDAFNGINWSKVQIATTDVTQLNKLLSDISTRKLLMLPLILAQSCAKIFEKDINQTKFFKLGFLGDGRKEKGLLEILRAAKNIIQNSDDITLLINVQNPRYFSSKEITELNCLVKSLREQDRIEILEGSLNARRYFDILNTLDAIILPYDPEDYKIRLSSIASECGLLGIPIVTTEHSSMGDWIQEGKLSGVIYRNGFGENKHETDIVSSINYLRRNYTDYKKLAIKKSRLYRKNCSVENYFKNIYKFYLTKYA